MIDVPRHSEPKVCNPGCDCAECYGKSSESLVCPFCGMSTWANGVCALPGCEGFGTT